MSGVVYMKKMKGKIENYINELQHDIKDFERIEDEWFYETTEQHSQKNWYGLESVSIDKVTLGDNSIIYLVNNESAAELIEQSSEKEKIVDTLTNPMHESGDEVLIAIFDTEKEAYNFIKKEFPKINLVKNVNDLIYEY